MASAPLALVQGRGGGEIRVDQRVAVDDGERLVAEKRADAGDRASGVEDGILGGIQDTQSVALAVPERRANLLGQVMEVDDHLGDARASEHAQRILDHRATADLEKRLGRRVGERP